VRYREKGLFEKILISPAKPEQHWFSLRSLRLSGVAFGEDWSPAG